MAAFRKLIGKKVASDEEKPMWDEAISALRFIKILLTNATTSNLMILAESQFLLTLYHLLDLWPKGKAGVRKDAPPSAKRSVTDPTNRVVAVVSMCLNIIDQMNSIDAERATTKSLPIFAPHHGKSTVQVYLTRLLDRSRSEAIQMSVMGILANINRGRTEKSSSTISSYIEPFLLHSSVEYFHKGLELVNTYYRTHKNHYQLPLSDKALLSLSRHFNPTFPNLHLLISALTNLTTHSSTISDAVKANIRSSAVSCLEQLRNCRLCTSIIVFATKNSWGRYYAHADSDWIVTSGLTNWIIDFLTRYGNFWYFNGIRELPYQGKAQPLVEAVLECITTLSNEAIRASSPGLYEAFTRLYINRRMEKGFNVTAALHKFFPRRYDTNDALGTAQDIERTGLRDYIEAERQPGYDFQERRQIQQSLDSLHVMNSFQHPTVYFGFRNNYY
ncbi:hypothetical protein BLNAU_20911 [Blattamonas nauphoetae]|uniref:Armadillo-like helical domain-containing protein n=1 Tax=Blattamonas nauphoetae TaxID=2049346 RepID=A0ABQ9WXD0_9EUKA|nr:hypothetical protein BLNAU_20911 [Blattamonas nauphoetae]